LKARLSVNTVIIELDAGTVKELFTAVAEVQEIFAADDACGNPACNSTRIRASVREVEGNIYYALKCGDCGAELAFGQRKIGGGLFPRRYDTETKETLPNRGWRKYVKPGSQGGGEDPWG